MLRMSIICTLQVEKTSASCLEESKSPLLDWMAWLFAMAGGWQCTAGMISTESRDDMSLHEDSRRWIWEVCALAKKGSKQVDCLLLMGVVERDIFSGNRAFADP